ncbi:MAG: M48 family metallopeptidase [Sulfuricella denitrificans]|nr:M48 family metallopeptidase [Sulfuricella denitrificans]
MILKAARLLHRLALGSEEISYLLRRSPRRHSIGLRISADGLTVSVPTRLQQQQWEQALIQKSAWILSRLEQMRTHATPPFIWQAGQMLPFLGSPVELAVECGNTRTQPRLEEGVLSVSMPHSHDPAALANKVVKWYRREALTFFQHRVAVYARQLGTEVSRLNLSNARTRWGSCTSRGDIRLNWRLIKAPPSVIDYVVAHELAHLIELNHSPAFWQTVSQLCPDYLELRAYLNAHASHYHQF